MEDIVQLNFKLISKELFEEFQTLKKNNDIQKLKRFPGKLNEKMKSNIQTICDLLNIKNFEDILNLIFDFGQSSKKDATYLNFMIDLASMYTKKNEEESSLILLNLALKFDPDCFFAWRFKVEHERYSNKEDLIKLISIGEKENRDDLDRYRYQLERMEDIPKDQFHALRIAAYKLNLKYKHLKDVSVAIGSEPDVLTLYKPKEIEINHITSFHVGEYLIHVKVVNIIKKRFL